MMADFFDYTCPTCEAVFCERVQIMNLALGLIDDPVCLSCLAREFQRDEIAMAQYCWDYIQTRDCFVTPWRSFDASACPRRLPEGPGCPCQLGDLAPVCA